MDILKPVAFNYIDYLTLKGENDLLYSENKELKKMYDVLEKHTFDLIDSLQAQITEQGVRAAKDSEKLINDMEKYKHLYNDALAQLAASQRREKAAVDDMKQTHCIGTSCYICKNHGKCERECIEIGHCALFEWRGPQDAEKGATE